MNPITVTVGPLAVASANNIALSQTPSAGSLTLNGALAAGGVATLDRARQVLITTAGNESSRTFTIVGTDVNGSAATETITGPNVTTAASVLSYATVTSITISGNAAGAVTVGTNGVASSAWVRLDGWAMSSIALQTTVSGTVNYTLQQTLDDPNSPTSPVAPSAVTWVNSPNLAMVNATATAQASSIYIPVFMRVVLNSGTGSVVATFQQASNAPF